MARRICSGRWNNINNPWYIPSIWDLELGEGSQPGSNPDGPVDRGSDTKSPTSGCPVSLASGDNLAFQLRSFGIQSLMPVDLNCRYRSTSTRVGLFGRGSSFAYDWYAQAAGPGAVRVISPQGARYLLATPARAVYFWLP